MKRWIGLWGILVVVMGGSGPAMAEEWSVAGHYAEACSCDPGCPCVYGSPATMGHCHAALAFNITQGNLINANALIGIRGSFLLKLYIYDAKLIISG